MSTGVHYLDIGIIVAVFGWIFWWMYSLSTKSRAQRKLEQGSRKLAEQPWDNDRVGRRGNR